MNLEEIRTKYTEKEIKKIKKNSREIPSYAGDSLDKLVLQLENLRRQGKLNCFVNFNGIKLYSIDVTMDSAYKQCLGCTKKTWLKKQKKWIDDYKVKTDKWKKESEERLPLWIEEGKKYIHSEKFENWEKTCISSAHNDYYGLEVKHALEIMKLLEDGIPFVDIKEKIEKQGHSGMSYSGTMNIILYYSKFGPLFYNYMNGNHMSKFDKKYVSKIRQLNERLYYGDSLEEVYEELKDHKIMEISILSESNNETKILNGTILVNKDGTFEGIVDNNNIISGKLFGEKGIVFANFCNYKKASNYCGINENGIYIGKHEIYSFDGNIDNGPIIIELTDSSKNFASEIGVEYQIDKVKKYFDEYEKHIIHWYTNNFDLEIDRILFSLKDSLEESLLDSLKLMLNTLRGKQELDVLAIPYNKPYVILSDKKEEFLNQKTDSESAKEISQMAETFRKNNLVGEEPVLKKTKTPER